MDVRGKISHRPGWLRGFRGLAWLDIVLLATACSAPSSRPVAPPNSKPTASEAPRARSAQGTGREDSGKKLIELRATAPDPTFMHAHAHEMDSVGFDGVVFEATATNRPNATYFGWRWWGHTRYEYDDFAQNIRDLKACAFQNLRENFLRLTACPGDVKWHDDSEFEVVVHNAKVAARVAHEGGARGVMLDVEQYATPLFRFDRARLQTTLSFEEYEAVVRRRARELIRAVNAEYPDLVVLLTYGYEITGSPGLREAEPYGLLGAFLDGLFEAADPRTTLVHAYERAYPFRQQKEYSAAYRHVRDDLAKQSGVPAIYSSRVQVGFGVWLDMGRSRHGWNATDFARNYFTPDEFAYTISAALRRTDRYVWVYSEQPQWWPVGPNWPVPRPVPREYVEALRRARRHPFEEADERYPARAIKGDDVRAQSQPDFPDAITFAELQKRWTVRANAPDFWMFRIDPDSVGLSERWYSIDAEEDEWSEIQVPRFWDEQRDPYHGVAWYRVHWIVPKLDVGTERVALLFGAVDESATVWLNGARVGQHDEGLKGWNKAFAVDVTDHVRAGESNTLVVRVVNRQAVGGIWKSVKLATRLRTRAGSTN